MLLSPRIRAVLLVAASTTLVAAGAPAPGPLGIGDPLFPHLGNPGYDVTSYDIAFEYSGDNSRPLTAVTRIDALATANLRHINLDHTQGKISSVQVGGEPAAFTEKGEDLVITPARPVRKGLPVTLTVRHTSDPGAGQGNGGSQDNGGWIRTRDGLVMANQADAAHRVFPSNDHPADKALFTFRITTPKGTTAVANGLPAGQRTTDRGTTWTYRTAHPMATELAQVSIGKSAVVHREGPNGLPVRDVVPAADRAKLEPWLKKTPDHVAWMEDKVGRYPFETYGVLIAGARTGFALETQTLSLFERDLFTTKGVPRWYVESVMVHELAHQWFGNSVSPRTWADLWLSEGHASWYEALFAEERADRSIEERMKAAYRNSDTWRASGGAPAAPEPAAPGKKLSLFRPIVYDGSALVLYALREEIGDRAFDRLERAWVQRYADGNATTADFTRLASWISGRDLSGFFQGWLYGEKTPAMPGHPDWRSTPPADETSRSGGAASEPSGEAPRPAEGTSASGGSV